MIFFVQSFKCPDFSTYDTDKCYLNGKIFNVRDEVIGDIVPNCRVDCKCRKHETAAEIECVDTECAESFDDDNPNCMSLYNDLRQCCQTSEICGELLYTYTQRL